MPGRRRHKPKGVTEEQLALMQRESASLDREFRLIEESYAADHLELVLVGGYLARIVGSSKISQYLQRHHPEIAAEFSRVVEQQATATRIRTASVR